MITTSIVLLFGGILTGIFISMGGHMVVKEAVVNRYYRFRKLNKLVATRYRNCCIILGVSIQILCKALWLSFIQWVNNSVRKLDKNLYEVSYIINGKLHKMVVKPIRGPAPVLLAINDEGDDITSQIVPYLGVHQDFHGYPFTPRFFGHSHVSLELSTGETITFENSDIMILEKK